MVSDGRGILDSKLYILLLDYEKKAFKGTTQLSASIQVVDEDLALVLDRVCENMKEYTLHNVIHCYNVLEIIASIIPEEISLNLVEIYILIHAVLFHDLGMAPTHEDVNLMKSSKEYEEFLNNHEWMTDDEALTEYIRVNHVKNSILYMKRYSSKISDVYGVNVSKWIENIILSHGISVGYIENHSEKYPNDVLIGDCVVNICYLSMLLRLGDILDFDNSRTPAVLYAHISPHNNVSLLEWQKHLSITGKRVSATNIRFDMNCKDIIVERKVRDFIKDIENQIFLTKQLILRKKTDTDYYLKLNDKVELNVYREGYLYNNYEITTDYFGLSRILMGQQLYSSEDVFIRELLQNSIDACRVRKMDMEKYNEPYEPLITINYDSETHVFSIEDNGCGIDEEILEKYVLKVGRSYYNSRQRDFNNKGESSINKFGIGLLSNFMVSDTIVIESKRYQYCKTTNPLWIELSYNSTYVYQKECNRDCYGTRISLKLKNEYVKMLNKNSLYEVICKYYLGDNFTIQVTTDNNIQNVVNLLQEEIDRGMQYPHDISIDLSCIPGIKGVIFLSKNKKYYSINSSIVSYKGFRVTKTSDDFLSFLSSYRLIINIDDPNQLDLNASRDNFIQNEKLNDLRTELYKTIVSKSKKANYTIDQNIQFNYRARLVGTEKQVIKILWENIKIDYWNNICWSKIDFITFIKEVMAMSFNILVIDNINRNNQSIIKNYGNEYIIIIDKDKIEWPILLYPFIKEWKYKVLEFCESVIQEYTIKFIDDIDAIIYEDMKDNTINASSIYNEKENEEELFAFIEIDDILLNCIINRNHPLSKLSRINKKNPDLDMYLNSLKEHLVQGFNKGMTEQVFSLIYNRSLGIWDGYSVLTKKEFISEEFINSANDYFDKYVFPKVITNEGIDYHLSIKSFPRWYFIESIQVQETS